MILGDVKAMLEASGLPVTYRSWPVNDAPPLPFICYLVSYSSNFMADGRVYCPIDHIQVELYTRHKDPDAEAAVEAALALPWQKTEEYIDTEESYQILYEIEV